MKNWILAMSALTASTFAASPFVTVPWNGHVGAVSFTFDDGLENQVKNLGPILDSMPKVKVTFFLTGMSSDLKKEEVIKGFAALSNKGHEIGNHSLDHSYLTNTSESDLKSKVIDYADTLEALVNGAGAHCKITSFATPYCANNAKVQETIGKRHFINRDCGWTGRSNWDTRPDNWFTLQAKTWERTQNTVDDMRLALDTAANRGDFSSAPSWLRPPEEGSWLVVLNHGVAIDNDPYAIDPKEIEAILNHARHNEMWIAPFGTIGAYYQAHFTMDQATATKAGDYFTADWELPHRHMPQNIPLKVKLNPEWVSSAFEETSHLILEQEGRILWPDEQGIFTLEFTYLKVIIRKATAAEWEDRTTRLESSQKNLQKKKNSKPNALLILKADC